MKESTKSVLLVYRVCFWLLVVLIWVFAICGCKKKVNLWKYSRIEQQHVEQLEQIDEITKAVEDLVAENQRLRRQLELAYVIEPNEETLNKLEKESKVYLLQ